MNVSVDNDRTFFNERCPVVCRTSERWIELRLGLLATGAPPVFRKVLKGYAVMLGGIIDITADRADILFGGFSPGEIHFGQDGFHGMVQVHHPVCLQILRAPPG